MGNTYLHKCSQDKGSTVCDTPSCGSIEVSTANFLNVIKRSIFIKLAEIQQKRGKTWEETVIHKGRLTI